MLKLLQNYVWYGDEGSILMAKEQRQETHHIRNKTILVVEDDDTIGAFLVQALTQETPYRAMLVSDSLQALNAFNNIKPCLFITDYKMPYMNGIELYDRLRSSGVLDDTPAIIMSAHLPEQEVKKRKLACLSKPFELDDLLNTVEQLLA